MRIVTDNAMALSKVLGIKARDLENILGFWCQRYPLQEREDGIQNLTLQLLEARPDNGKHAFGICRKATAYWWRQYKVRQHYRLEYIMQSDDGDKPRELIDFIGGIFQYESIEEVNGRLDGQSLWKQIPPPIKPILAKRLIGRRLSDCERKRLNRWVKGEGVTILLNC